MTAEASEGDDAWILGQRTLASRSKLASSMGFVKITFGNIMGTDGIPEAARLIRAFALLLIVGQILVKCLQWCLAQQLLRFLLQLNPQY